MNILKVRGDTITLLDVIDLNIIVKICRYRFSAFWLRSKCSICSSIRVEYSVEMASAAIEDVFKDRAERTVKLSLSAEGRPYSRKDILEAMLEAEVPRDAIEAIGMRERNVEWEVTMKSTPARDRLLQKRELRVKGTQCSIGGIRKGTRRLRIFYLPYYVPIAVITQQLTKMHVSIVKTFQDRDKDTGLMSNIWNVLIETEHPTAYRTSFAGHLMV